MRPSRNTTLMRTAAIFGQRSTCSRLQVGAVFSREGRILVTGYNGAPAGLPHCDHECDCDFLVGIHAIECASRQPCTRAEHAERNGIAFAARHGVSLEGSELHVTHMPCLACAMSIINAGVFRVTYDKHYRDMSGIELLHDGGVVIDQFRLG